MKPKIIILALLVLIALAIIPVSSQTILMANPAGIAERDIAVYYPNGTMQGLWNSTSTIVLDNSSDYIFAMKPMQTNPMEDPSAWLATGFAFVASNIIPLIAIIFLAALWLGRK